MKNSPLILMLATIAVLLPACFSFSNTKIPQTAVVDRNHSVVAINNPISLADFLVSVPGVFVDEMSGRTMVTIRGGKPLYIIDGVRIGNSYAGAASAVSVYDIDSVEVLKNATETNIYGRDAAFGVIIIKTKREE